MTALNRLFQNHRVYKIEERVIPYFGGDPRQLLIILETHPTYFFASPHYYFLAKILKALNLNYSKVGLIEAHDQLDLDAILENLKPKKLLLFGHHNPLTQAGQCEASVYHSKPYLFGPHLETLYNDPLQKKRFWQALKKFI